MAVSDTVCSLRECCGYESGTCDGGSSTTASEMSESLAGLRGGHRRKRGKTGQRIRRAIRAASEPGDVEAADRQRDVIG